MPQTSDIVLILNYQQLRIITALKLLTMKKLEQVVKKELTAREFQNKHEAYMFPNINSPCVPLETAAKIQSNSRINITK